MSYLHWDCISVLKCCHSPKNFCTYCPAFYFAKPKAIQYSYLLLISVILLGQYANLFARATLKSMSNCIPHLYTCGRHFAPVMTTDCGILQHWSTTTVERIRKQITTCQKYDLHIFCLFMHCLQNRWCFRITIFDLMPDLLASLYSTDLSHIETEKPSNAISY